MHPDEQSSGRRRPRRVATSCVVLLCTLLLAAGCSSGSSPRQELRHAWSEVKNALVAGRAATFCALLSDNARAQLLALTGGAASCESAAATAFDVGRDARAQFAGAHLISIAISGDAATTTDSTGPPADRWTRVNGAWKLAAISS
jgi:hypothetical protein